MNTISKMLVFFCVTTLMLVVSTGLVFGESMETTSYNVNLIVNEDNSFQVEQTINVVFTEPQHGIYVYVPYRGTAYREIDGEIVEQHYRVDISNIKVRGYEFETLKEDGYYVLRIGDADVYLIGAQTYTVDYMVTLYDDGIDTQDDVYWELIPRHNPTGITVGTFNIEMPKSFPTDEIYFYTDSDPDSSSNIVNYSIDGLDLSGTLNRSLEPGEGVTVHILLPEGYFVGEKTMMVPTVLMYLLILLAPLLCLLLWMSFGRDEKIVKTVEFYPPDGVTSAEIGYILDGSSDNKDLVSLIMYWANKGYLTIEQKGKKDFTLIRQKALPETAKTYELTMFNGLFISGDHVDLSQLEGSFYNTFAAAKTQLQGYFIDSKENRQFTKKSKIARALGLILMTVPFLTLSFMGTYITFRDPLTMIITIALSCMLFLCFFPIVFISDKWQSTTKKEKITKIIIPILLGFIFYFLMQFFIRSLGMEVATIAATIASLICLVATVLMRKRTKKSVVLMGKILGFKDFIKTAELDKLKLLVAEDPKYFYNVLPYAYVFGLTDKWAKHFEKMAIEPPTWYFSDGGWSAFNTILFVHAFNSCSSSLTSTISIPPMPSNDGTGNIGSGTGGGFGGGGGFSGGGFGGGGFGSW